MKAIFFDRDGTLNIDPGYINNPADMKLFKDVPSVLKYLKSLRYMIFIISNQSGIGRAKIKPGQYRDVNERFVSLCGGYDIIDDVFYCPHTPEQDCPCRKPGTLFVDIADERCGIERGESYFIGDKMTDILAGKKSGLKTILILNGVPVEKVPHYDELPNVKADYIINAISEIKKIIKN
ncbi:MAG: HAD family hydrolase [Spirochaetes bacterium]|nr:HAD family hydrolase [Spirochaetota bacterium]